MGEIIFHVLLMAVMGFFYKESLLIDSGRAADPIGPGGFPQAIIIFILVLLAVSLYQAIRKWKTRYNNDPKGHIPEFSKAYLGVLASIIGFVLIVDTLGFTLTAVLFFLVLYYFLGRKINVKEVGTVLLFSLGFTVVFGTILNLQLPRGMEAIKAISYWIY